MTIFPILTASAAISANHQNRMRAVFFSGRRPMASYTQEPDFDPQATERIQLLVEKILVSSPLLVRVKSKD